MTLLEADIPALRMSFETNLGLAYPELTSNLIFG